jgi:hypothetical protein
MENIEIRLEHGDRTKSRGSPDMTRKIVIAFAFVASVTAAGVSQAAPIVVNPSAITAAASNDVTKIQWQVWAGRLAWAGAGALAYRAWQRTITAMVPTTATGPATVTTDTMVRPGTITAAGERGRTKPRRACGVSARLEVTRLDKHATS